MITTMYVQTDEAQRITDIISYPHEGYQAVTVNLPLPVAVMGGAYELRDGQILYRREWDVNKDILELQAQIAYIGMMTEVV